MKNKRARKTIKKSSNRGYTAKKSMTRWHEALIAGHHTLSGLPNVERIALGWKERGGKTTSRMAVKIYVSEKKDTVRPEEALPKSVKVLIPIGKGIYKTRRVPTDVVWHASADFLIGPSALPGDFLDPVLGGAAISLPGRLAGSFACLAVDQQDRKFALTAGHVIQQFQGAVTPGLQIVQPPVPPPEMPPNANPSFGLTAGGFFGNAPDQSGFLDFALLNVDSSRAVSSRPLDGGPMVPQVMPAGFVISNQIPMTKFGASTGRTAAVFSAKIDSMIIAGITVTNVLEFKGIPGRLVAAGGDSGALAVSDAQGSQGIIIGILFAATGPTPDAPAGRAYVMPLERLSGLRPI